MQTEFAVPRCTRKCAVLGRPLEPGEDYVAVVIGDEDQLTRQDIAAAAWTVPPPKAVGWWRCRMPAAAARKLRPAPTGVLLDILSDLVQRPDKQALAYLLALLLCRRRVLVDEFQAESVTDSPSQAEREWRVTCPADGRQWTVPVAIPSPDLVEALQAELNTLLFTEE